MVAIYNNNDNNNNLIRRIHLSRSEINVTRNKNYI